MVAPRVANTGNPRTCFSYIARHLYIIIISLFQFVEQTRLEVRYV